MLRILYDRLDGKFRKRNESEFSKLLKIIVCMINKKYKLYV